MNKKILPVLVMLALLQGCVPAAFVIGATAGGAIIYDNRTMKTMVADKNIAYQALSNIRDDEALFKSTHIVVTSFNRILLVAGQAPTATQRQKAFELVQRVPNVRRVYNEITITTPTDAKRRLKDDWITTKVKSQMLTTKGLHSTQMKILTENGVVYLLGLVTPAQGDMAANVARRVDGVVKVVKLFEYLP